MINEKMKIFKDSVHGYIQIPETIVKYIIDTQLFQRLRCIEQTICNVSIYCNLNTAFSA